MTFAIITFPEPISLLDFWEEILRIAEYPPRDAIPFTFFWLGHLYWPIRWITTGQKSPLPWVANKETINV